MLLENLVLVRNVLGNVIIVRNVLGNVLGKFAKSIWNDRRIKI